MWMTKPLKRHDMCRGSVGKGNNKLTSRCRMKTPFRLCISVLTLYIQMHWVKLETYVIGFARQDGSNYYRW